MLLITMGDPNGIGPEILCRFFGENKNFSQKILILGPEEPLDYFSKMFSIERFWTKIDDVSHCIEDKIYLYEQGLNDFRFTPGRPSVDGGKISGLILKNACQFIKKGFSSAIVTCPINKSTLIDAGFKFPGHTEFLAHEFGLGPDDICMHLYGERLKVSLVTTHPPLKDVPSMIYEEKIIRCLSLTWEMLCKLNENKKPIGVCGLNPHAGENGKIGTEEINIIKPAIEKAKEKDIKVKGPYPADTIFYRALKGEFSAILAMYHDQGLAPLKLLEFNKAVNITLGLPFVRTSVDHGTAYEIVGKKIAETTSLKNAIKLANRLI